MIALDVLVVAGGIAVFLLALLFALGLCMAAAAGDRASEAGLAQLEAREHLRDPKIVVLPPEAAGTTEAGSPVRSRPASARARTRRGPKESLWEA